ncbi:hypothetical protein B0H14DRAFT_3456336 [Mycena olivaceomarginata]|nr:hypothetical protein B0H14DRAFT_3456336 [Mycena olivaceomarginata]
MPPMVWSVSSLPVPVEREGEEAESRARTAPLLPLLRLVCIGDEEGDEDAWVDADNDDNDDNEGGDEDEGMTVVDDRDHAQDGEEELPTPVPWRSELAPRTPPTLASTSTSACRPRITRVRGGGGGGEGEEPQTPVPHLYEWEATPAPYSEAEREREREGEQVGGKRGG